VNIEVGVGQHTPQRRDRIDDLTISAAAEYSQQGEHLRQHVVELIGHLRNLVCRDEQRVAVMSYVISEVP
jgi:hypothetical protein